VTTAIEQLTAGVTLLTPELILLATICVMFITGPFFVSEAGVAPPGLRKRWGALSLMALAAAGYAWLTAAATHPVGMGPFRVDDLTWYVRGLSIVSGAVLAAMLIDQIDDNHAAEGQACLLSILLGANLTAIANDLVGLFLALELVSIPTYVLLYLPRRGQVNQEATIKYMLLSIFSSAITLYGMSLLYGAAGTTSLEGIRAALHSQPQQATGNLIRMAAALLIAGLSYRIAAVPFHFYAPDVFQGVTSACAAMLSYTPKVVGFVALVRLLPLAGGLGLVETPDGAPTPRLLLAAMAFATMVLGNILALRQQNLYRLLAYSSIAHAGYMLIGLVVGASGAIIDGVSALLFYLAVYGVMTIGAFALLAAISTSAAPVRMQRDLAGLSRVHPAIAIALAVCLFSLTGLPPTAGFTGKLNLFFASWAEGTALGQSLAIALAVNAAISAWYYLRLIAIMFLEQPETAELRKASLAPVVAGVACAVGTVLLFVSPQALLDAASRFSQ
jgi:NADH-quinone oxidoreductase subunit N